LGGVPPAVVAQNADLTSASVNTCNVKGSVSITVLGVVTTVPVTCINPSQETSPGNDEESVTGNVIADVPGVVRVADLAAPYGESNYVNAPNKTWLAGGTNVEDASLVQGMVAASGVRGLVICESNTGDSTLHCSAYTEIAQLSVNGQAVTLPPAPIPLNHTLAVTGGAVQITVLGIPVSVPVSGSLTLSEVTSSGVGTPNLTIEHAPLHVRVNGSVNVAGIGVVGLAVDVMDWSTANWATSTHNWGMNWHAVEGLPTSEFGCTAPGGSCAPTH